MHSKTTLVTTERAPLMYYISVTFPFCDLVTPNHTQSSSSFLFIDENIQC